MPLGILFLIGLFFISKNWTHSDKSSRAFYQKENEKKFNRKKKELDKNLEKLDNDLEKIKNEEEKIENQINRTKKEYEEKRKKINAAGNFDSLRSLHKKLNSRERD